MTTEERNKYRQTWEAELAKQRPHPVYLPVRVRWDLPWDERGCVVEMGQRIAVDESHMEPMTDEARRNAWLDKSFIVESNFVEWTGSALQPSEGSPRLSRTATGEPIVPWAAITAEGTQFKPLTALMNARRALCDGTEKDTFNAGWLSEGYRAVFIEMGKLRLACPGAVLELLELGGNRAGKTFGMLLCAVANWYASPRPEGTEFGPQWKGQKLIMHSGETTSASEHQVPFYYMMPAGIRSQARNAQGGTRMKKTEDTVFNFSGSGFTNGSFNLPIVIARGDGDYESGGETRFRSYYGAPNTYEGPEYDLIEMDEEVPITVYDNMKRGMASRAVVTNEQWFLDEIARLLEMLTSNVPMTQIPRYLLGLLFQSWIIAMFTPVSGFTQLVRTKLQGLTHADFYGWYHSPILAGMQGVPVDTNKPGGDKRLVPQFAKDPGNPNQLIAWFHTRWNCVKPAVRTMFDLYRAAGWKEVRKRLYGFVESDTSSTFGHVYDEQIHLCKWADISREGTIYEIVDPASSKPWAMTWVLVDRQTRVWILQEWPCEHILIDGASPGPWAITSRKERLNGDEGPAYSLPSRTNAEWVLQLWEGRRRILEKFKETGEAYRGKVITRKLVIGMDFADGKPSPRYAESEQQFIEPFMSIMDSRGGKDKFDAHTPAGVQRLTLFKSCMIEAEIWNPVEFWEAAGKENDFGASKIIDLLKGRVNHEPRLRINDECTNTRFMFRTRTVPPFRENASAKDEVCEEWFDNLAMGATTEDGLVYVEPVVIDNEVPWGGYV